jgi:hypothetical protein
VSAGRAFAEGAASGLSANLRDEIYGLSRASGLPEILGGFRAPVGAARLGYEYATGQPGEASSAYEVGRDYMRGIQKSAEEQHPLAYPGGEITGAVAGMALPATRGAEGASLLARAGRTAATGAGYGALSGFGAGEGAPESLQGAAIGGAIGGALGGAFPVLGAVGSFAGRKAAEYGSKAYQALRGSISPTFIEDEAGRRIAAAHAADFAKGQVWTPEQLAAARQAGVEPTAADIGGETTRAVARAAANQSPEAREALTTLAGERFAGQSQRTAQFVRGLVGNGDASTIAEQLQDRARRANAPAYKRLYQQNSDVIWSPELARPQQAPAGRRRSKTLPRTARIAPSPTASIGSCPTWACSTGIIPIGESVTPRRRRSAPDATTKARR